MIQANMCELHQLNLSSIYIISLYIFCFVLIFTFQEEGVSWCPASAILKLGCRLEQVRNVTDFDAQTPPDQCNQKLWRRNLGVNCFESPQVIPLCIQV